MILLPPPPIGGALPPIGLPTTGYPAPTPASLWAGDWQTIAWNLEGAFITPWRWNDASGSLRVTIPTEATGILSYLSTNQIYDLAGWHYLRMSLSVIPTSGAPWISYPTNPIGGTPNPCISPAAGRLILLNQNPTWFGTIYDRWWSTTAVEVLHADELLAAPTADLTNLSAWFAVDGTSAALVPQAFTDALTASRIGITFGGGCFAGHGVDVVNGTADVSVQWFWVE